MCRKTGYGSWVFLVRYLLLTGFVQSLEFLKTSWHLPNTFPEPEKVCKIEVKSWKNGKKSWFFFLKLQQVLLKWNVFCVCEILFNLACLSWKKLCSCRIFLSSLLITYFITLSLEKEIIVLEKVQWKSWILDKNSVRTLCLCSREREPCILALYVSRVTKINFLLTTSADPQE